MGGTNSASVVPCAWCWVKPNRKTNAGTMMTSPPIPISQLNIPAATPKAVEQIFAHIGTAPVFTALATYLHAEGKRDRPKVSASS